MKGRTIFFLLSLSAALVMLDTTLQAARPGSGKKESAVVALAGEFRTVFANLLWIKLDHYHHEYAARHKDWTKNRDALGLNRMITRLDPHFVEAYATGAWMLLGMGKLKDAKSYLEEGVTSNPDSMLLHDELGTMLAVHLKDYDGSLFHLKKAYCIVKADWEIKKLRSPSKKTTAIADDEWDMRRLKRLIGSVERLQREGEGKV